jgi:hypothetical protein
MYDEHEQFDEDLARLAQSLRSGEHMLGCLQLAEFALKLDQCIRCEERALSLRCEGMPTSRPTPIAKVRNEHASIRRLVGLIATALDRADDRRCLELIGKLRSVLLLHLAKEEALQPMLHAPLAQ